MLGGAGELLQVQCGGKDSSIHPDLEEIFPSGEDETAWSPARCISQARRTFPAWSEGVVAGTNPCQAVGELPGLATASFLTCRSCFLKAGAWSCSAKEDLLAVDENKKCHCCSVWGQEKAGWLITSAGHFFLLQGIICF